MKNLHHYNRFIQSLEKQAKGGLHFHYINRQIYITDFTQRLLGIWDLYLDESIDWKKITPPL